MESSESSQQSLTDRADSLLSDLKDLIEDQKAEILALRGQIGKLKLDNKELVNINIILSTKISQVEAIFASNNSNAALASKSNRKLDQATRKKSETKPYLTPEVNLQKAPKEKVLKGRVSTDRISTRERISKEIIPKDRISTHRLSTREEIPKDRTSTHRLSTREIIPDDRTSTDRISIRASKEIIAKNTRILLMGGNENQTGFHSFSTVSNQWRQLTDLPSKRFLHGSVLINDQVYMVGGMENKTIEKYNCESKKLKEVNKMKKNRYFFGICPYKSDQFILAGGYESSAITSTCFSYNITTNRFKQIDDLDGGVRYGLYLVNCRGTVYAIGGCNESEETLDIIEKYDAKTDTWKVAKTELITARTLHRAVAYNEIIYVIGGMKENEKIIGSIERFNTQLKTIEVIKPKLSVARCNFAICSHQSNVYIIGGFGHSKGVDEDAYTRSMEIFDVESESLRDGKHIPVADQAFTACFV